MPSRVNPGSFYALPQSPQLLKQLLMVGGFDRYFQIARCFRDEDLRANRQPEFSQVDIEMTCPRLDDIMGVAEGMMAAVYRRSVLGVESIRHFCACTYAEAMERFGIDKPDLRFGMELKNLGAAFATAPRFKVFAEVLARGESIYGIVLPGGASVEPRELDEMAEGVGAPWAGPRLGKVAGDGWQGPIATPFGRGRAHARGRNCRSRRPATRC